ncbi:uncharacterized protein PV07_01433 [Cladophialophora immunda]|uniref:Metallo-beta-lactamase domain-containing protein n=1 Tax=Cladophialophora immunda TaxID=569365 RepID=A0A0D2A310_9EURO|nr:uncharacterized protein PV07_01433 [Cladophialophora immunda]KIW34666.1 hypothetical protein PV07_01433 [Cladophialophora immunda]
MTVKAQAFIESVVPGLQQIEIPDAAFLIDNEATGQKVLFDLGVRKDYWNLPPVLLSLLARGVSVTSLKTQNDITEILEDNKIDLGEICMSWY